MSQSPVICWFRRDLRLTDHLALSAAIRSGNKVIPLFIFDPAILGSPRFSVPRYKFMLNALESLRAELNKHDRNVLIRYGDVETVLQELIQETGTAKLYFNTDYTPYARQRDAAITARVNIPVETFHDRLLVPPGAVMKDDGTPYVVYSPFKKRWRELEKSAQELDYEISTAHLHSLDDLHNERLPEAPDTIDVPEATEAEALRRLKSFMKEAVFTYKEDRNRLGNPQQEPLTGTSFLSPYIRFGLISLRQIYWAAREAYSSTSDEKHRESVTAFVDEIAWHEFYTHILWHFPQVRTRNFHDKYDRVKWENSDDYFQAWKDGMTGYPIVDAAMRQLKSTGWMHNRARMIVASFLSKDLMIDWRKGELYFMQWLLDGDLAANNGGWQWSAGTGTDAQPYFRIFNPVSQSEKFDPDGSYIRHWVPELRAVPDEFIHEPWRMKNPPANYPSPIIDHSEARKLALQKFEVVKGD